MLNAKQEHKIQAVVNGRLPRPSEARKRKNHRQLRNRSPTSSWCVSGLLRSERPPSAGRNGVIAGGVVWSTPQVRDPLSESILSDLVQLLM